MAIWDVDAGVATYITTTGTTAEIAVGAAAEPTEWAYAPTVWEDDTIKFQDCSSIVPIQLEDLDEIKNLKKCIKLMFKMICDGINGSELEKIKEIIGNFDEEEEMKRDTDVDNGLFEI